MDGSRPRGEGGPGTGVQTWVMGVNRESRYTQAGGTLFKFIHGGSNEGNRRVLRESLYVGGREERFKFIPVFTHVHGRSTYDDRKEQK